MALCQRTAALRWFLFRGRALAAEAGVLEKSWYARLGLLTPSSGVAVLVELGNGETVLTRPVLKLGLHFIRATYPE